MTFARLWQILKTPLLPADPAQRGTGYYTPIDIPPPVRAATKDQDMANEIFREVMAWTRRTPRPNERLLIAWIADRIAEHKRSS